MTVVLIQECKRFLVAIPFAGTCSSCGMAARWWPTLKKWTHTYKVKKWTHTYKVDETWCFPTQDRHFLEIERF